MLIDLTGCEIGCHSRIGYEINSSHYHPINMMLRVGELVTLSDHQEKSEGMHRPLTRLATILSSLTLSIVAFLSCAIS
ncbi:hypothetical protein CY34DRAFT_544197 [Suillus luteus UH-Slu-Lm8-n1]|uniref:Uncharacterized protein n=1 Tax=Suillus luteus UH-Slu-Lm8-n1 TaxID=930992 RepID=A0A0D0A304_9AGAM|nr:hypothetical protein CY34DRAFT_544197 [Suillus luteus UH-Slu-Lm8-n1]